MGTLLDPGIIPKTTENALAITEAGDLLFQYLRLAQTNNLIDAVTLDPSRNPVNSLTNSLVAEASTRRKVRDILLQLNTEGAPSTDQVRSQIPKVTTAGYNPNISVVEIPPENYSANFIGSGIDVTSLAATRDAGSESNSDKNSTKITHFAVVGSNEDLNFSDRGADYVALFANLIPSVEMSLCVPHLRVDFVQNLPNPSKGAFMPFMTLESFLGAGIAGRDNVSKYGLNTLPTALDTQPLAPFSIGNRTSGMELFLAPQTLINPDINNTALYQASRGIEAIDPMQPLMSIESVNFDVSAISQNFMMTTVKVSLSLILHDRSRLAEISPLVTPSLNPMTRAIVEFGWNHPDSNPFTNNVFAKFLNALKTKQVFNVTSAAISNRDSTSLSVRLELISTGNSSISDVSVYTGKYVSYGLFKSRVDQLLKAISGYADSGKDGETPTSPLITATQEIPVSTSDWDSGDKWIPFEYYKKLIDSINTDSINEKDVTEILDTYRKIITDTRSSAVAPGRLYVVKTPDGLRADMIREINKFDYRYSKYKSAAGSDSAFSFLTSTVVNVILSSDGATTSTGENGSFASKAFSKSSPSIIALGDAIFRIFTIPMSMAKIFDEIRVMIFDFNDHAGYMGGYNIGLLPIKSSAFTSKLSSKTTCKEALDMLISIANDPSYSAYGVRLSNIQKDSVQDTSAESSGTSAVTGKTGDDQRAEFTRRLNAVYKAKQTSVPEKFGNVSYETKFTQPVLKVEMQVVPTVGEDGTVKQILCVFVHDSANSGKRPSNVLLSAIRKSTGVTTVYNVASDVQNLTAEQNGKIFTVEKDTTTGRFNVTVSRSQAKNILTAAYPTIRIGSEGTTIINASYNTSISGEIENVKKLQAVDQAYNGVSEAGSYAPISADLFIVPASVTISMLGMPLINRGQNFYIDFGTGTTIDNVYTVTTAKHSIKGGQFTTTVTLSWSGEGSIASVYDMIDRDLYVMKQYTKNKTPA